MIEMVEKVKKIETVLHAMTRKVLILEKEMTEVKKNNKVLKVNKNIDIESPQIISEKNYFTAKSSSVQKVKDSSLEVKEATDETKKRDTKEEFSCKKCDYKTKKEAILIKHMITKHDNHESKKCKENLPSFMALLKHIAEHEKEGNVEVKEGKSHDGTNIITKDKEEKEYAVVNTNVQFTESMEKV